MVGTIALARPVKYQTKQNPTFKMYGFGKVGVWKLGAV